MKKILWVLSAVLLSLSPMGAAPAASPKNASATYTVQKGDSLYSISRKHQTTIRALREANGLTEEAILRPGQILKVPSSKKDTAKSTPPVKKVTGKKAEKKKGKSKPRRPATYKVEAGDSPSIIAQRFGVSTKELLDANGMKHGDLIRVGQVLKIPGGTQEKAQDRKTKSAAATPKKSRTKQTAKKPKEEPSNGEKTYTVASGDTLFSIARRYKIPLNDLMALNGIRPTDVIKPGQVLKVPSKSYAVKEKAKTPPKKAKVVKKVKKEKAVYHTVKHGDVLWKIAKKYGVTVREIRKLNKLSRRSVIRSGQRLLIKPGSEEKTAQVKPVKKKQARYYTVKHGDSLWKIAKAHKLPVAELRRYNKMTTGSILHKGMKLVVGYEEVPATKVAKTKVEKKKKSTKVAKKKTQTKKAKKKVRVASKSRKKSRKKSADRRISSAMSVLNGRGGGGAYSSRAGQDIIRTAKRYLGRRYVWGAEGPSSFDCSGFTQYVLRKSKGVKLPRVSRKQAYYGKYVTRSQLRPGDLIFFDTSRRRRGYVNHVGIYIGNGKFIHASSARHRVVITSLNSPFYRARFKWGRRVN